MSETAAANLVVCRMDARSLAAYPVRGEMWWGTQHSLMTCASESRCTALLDLFWEGPPGWLVGGLGLCRSGYEGLGCGVTTTKIGCACFRMVGVGVGSRCRLVCSTSNIETIIRVSFGGTAWGTVPLSHCLLDVNKCLIDKFKKQWIRGIFGTRVLRNAPI